MLGLCIISLGCEPSPQQKLEKIEADVMASHDSAMALMSEIYTKKKELTTLKDSLAGKDTAAHRMLTEAITNLTHADEAMMGWMHQYQVPDKAAPDKAIEYLQAEKKKIAEVREEMHQSLETAQELEMLYDSPYED